VSQQGTYEWALALSDHTRLATGAGPVDGHDPQSFRSKGQGMLSVVCLLHRLLRWTSSDLALTGVLATDNSGLVGRATQQAQLKYSVPNTTFQSNWDIMEAIVRTVAQAKLSVTYQYVRGHQDEKTP
jgi:hypothetical protein